MDSPGAPDAMQPTPLSLLERLRTAPDETSWSRLAGLYTPLIRQWLGRQGVGPADADDLTQEILVVVFRELQGFEHNGHTGAFRRWVRGITVNRLLAFLRARNCSSARPSPWPLDQLEDPTRELERRWDDEHDLVVTRRLLELIQPEFSANTWLCFHRQIVDNAPAREVADELGMSVNAVLIAKSRVLRRLRQEGRGLIDEAG